MEIAKDFIARIDRLRLVKQWTWEQTASAVGLSRSMVHFIRTGKHRATDKVLFRLEQAETDAGISGRHVFENLSALSPETKAKIFELSDSLPNYERKILEDLLQSYRESLSRGDKFKVTEPDLKRGYVDFPLEYRIGKVPKGQPEILRVSAIGSFEAAKLLPQIAANKIDIADVALLSFPKGFWNDTFLNQLTPTCISSMICVAMLLSYGLTEGQKILTGIGYKFGGN